MGASMGTSQLQDQANRTRLLRSNSTEFRARYNKSEYMEGMVKEEIEELRVLVYIYG